MDLPSTPHVSLNTASMQSAPAPTSCQGYPIPEPRVPNPGYQVDMPVPKKEIDVEKERIGWFDFSLGGSGVGGSEVAGGGCLGSRIHCLDVALMLGS